MVHATWFFIVNCQPNIDGKEFEHVGNSYITHHWFYRRQSERPADLLDLESGAFVGLGPENLRKTNYGGRPAYQHQVRSHLTNLTQSGDLKKLDRGVYSITAAGRKRIAIDNDLMERKDRRGVAKWWNHAARSPPFQFAVALHEYHLAIYTSNRATSHTRTMENDTCADHHYYAERKRCLCNSLHSQRT